MVLKHSADNKISPKQTLSGFTMIELIIVIAISVITATASVGVVYNYYITAQVDAEARSIEGYLRFAKQEAIGNAAGEDYSVRFITGGYVGFFGTTYSAVDPDNDDNTYHNPNLTISTTFTDNQLTFENYTGRATAGGSVTITGSNGASKQISVNTLGVID